MVEYRVAEENATRVAFSSAHRFKLAMRVQNLEVELFQQPSRNADTPVRAIRPPHNSAGRSVRITKSAFRFMVAMRVLQNVEAPHESGRNRSLSMCQLLMHMHQKFVIGLYRFTASMCVQEPEDDPFHEPMRGSAGFQPAVSRVSNPLALRHASAQSQWPLPRPSPRVARRGRAFSIMTATHWTVGRFGSTERFPSPLACEGRRAG